MNSKAFLTRVFWGTVAGAITSPAGPVTPADYVQIHNGKFELHGQPFVLRGANYFGSWRFPCTITAADGVEHATIWSVFHAWDVHMAALDFAFLREHLRATAVRIGTPARDELASLVTYHGYAPWYETDGSISDGYMQKLIQLADTAYAGGIRIQVCLLWNVGGEIAKNPDDFAPGGTMDRFYSNQVRSIGLALRDHPGVMAFSIGNEVLVNWLINGRLRSAFEGRAAAFKKRRLRELRSVAPLQLLTDDEVASPASHTWHDPGPEFAMVTDSAEGQEAHPFRVADEVDYLGPHCYPEVLKPQDVPDDAFRPKLVDALQKLADYMKIARVTGKPVVIDEFGLKINPPTLAPTDYTRWRDELYSAYLPACEKEGVQGLLAWIVLPEFVLRPGDYAVTASHLNRYSPVEVDIRSSARRILFCEPVWDLFVWDVTGDIPRPTPAAKAIAAAWRKAQSRRY